jgi:hypothetical protein
MKFQEPSDHDEKQRRDIAMNWTPCPKPKAGDVIRWKEPLWAAPTKKRGKRDRIGEQLLTAEVKTTGDSLELQVQAVEILSLDNGAAAPPGVKPGDSIRRKKSTIEMGAAEKMAGAGK